LISIVCSMMISPAIKGEVKRSPQGGLYHNNLSFLIFPDAQCPTGSGTMHPTIKGSGLCLLLWYE
jgi:hypothetical protein